MALFKCKMCGGALEILNNETVVECDYCGAQQTIPKLDDDRRANLYDRANHFRRNNEFDKAMGIYEQILNEDNADAEAYWSLVLCRYGIEYVEDPSSRKRVPTVNRAQFTSIFEDDNYKSALRYADLYQKAVYENEAKAINEIQKSILAISQREEPFDVFICYKESDNAGRRTPDSVLANDLYHQLTQEGFKVFFARITLEDKLGAAYEPYIFAALNSAKVMVALGTKPEYFKAVWVRNEWSRYLSLIKNGAKKMLIPAYKDMDPYDLPEEFSHLQAQDMSKLGFMQDLIRGVKKILDVDASRSNVVKETIVAGNANTAPLLKRAFMFLEDGDWRSADEYCEKVLDLDPECAEAYLGKLMVELKVTSRQKLEDCATPFDGKNNFQKAMRFAGENLQKELQGYIDFIINRNLTNAYNDAVHIMQSAKTEEAYKKAAAKFKELHNFKDSKELAKKCSEEAERARLLALYNAAVSARNSAENEKQFKAAANRFTAIGTFKDSETLAAECLDMAEKARLEALYASALAAMNTAKTEQQYKTAAEQFEAIKTFKDAQEQYIACVESAEASRKNAIYSAGIVLMNNRVKRIEDFQAAIEEFQKIYGWKDADDKIIECQDIITAINAEMLEQEQQRERDRQARLAAEKKRKIRNWIVGIIAAVLVCAVVVITTVIIPNGKYNSAIALMNEAKYEDAIVIFEGLNGYRDSEDKIMACRYYTAVALMEGEKYTEAIDAFNALEGYSDSAKKIKECNTAILDIKYNDALVLMNSGKYEKAIEAFEAIIGHKDSYTKISSCKTAIQEEKYNSAISLLKIGSYEKAITAFEALDGYKDSASKALECKKELLKAAKVGDYVSFGTFELDDNKSNGKESIEWLVLEKKNGKILVISKHVLELKEYHEYLRDVTWEGSTLRSWLNNKFLNSAFSSNEKTMISAVTVSADKNPDWKTNPGKATTDRLFLLSINEVNKYLKTESARKATLYGKNGGCYWWLRTPGTSGKCAAEVSTLGEVNERGSFVNYTAWGVRPAMWIDISK